MNFLRNKSVKMLSIVFIAMTLVFTVIGFCLGKEVGILIFLVCLSFVMVSLHGEKKKYEKLADLADRIDMILNSDEFVTLEESKEGDFAILESEIRKMTTKIREGAYLIQKEKIYLNDSIADISHQLRTPLTTINLIMSFLQAGELGTTERMRYVAEVNSHLKRIDWLISSLLKISKLDAGTVAMKQEKVYVSSLVGKAAESIMIPLEIRNQLFDFVSTGNETFIGDKNWSVEAVSNIIKNCMEHTPEKGHILVEASENILYTKIIIEDTGPGIEKEDLPHIFERFYKGKNSANSSVGIGLALSRMIIQNQNGSIKVENKKEGGSRFTIKFYKGGQDGRSKSRKSV